MKKSILVFFISPAMRNMQNRRREMKTIKLAGETLIEDLSGSASIYK